MLLNYLGKPKLLPFFFTGFFLTVYLKLDTMAIAVFGTIIGLLVLMFSGENKNRKEDGVDV